MTHKYYQKELKAAQKRLEKWQKQADKINDKYLDSKSGEDLRGDDTFSLNLFHSNVATLDALLYGNIPQVDVSRKYADANDDIARVAGEMIERLLNCDISANSESYDAVLRGALQDRLLGGLGVGRVRYEITEKDGEITSESAPVDYYHWRDVLWGWGRNFSDLPWLAYRSYLSKAEVETRFGKEVRKELNFKVQITSSTEEQTKDSEQDSVAKKAEIWEIWDKERKKVVWFSFDYDQILEEKDDTLKLKKFFPSPPFFIANATTSLYIPTPDYTLSQDLYNEIDVLQSRIAIITSAVKVIGVYDQSAEGISRMFQEGVDNTLIPVDNWAMFAERGGLVGGVQWFPVQDVVMTLDKLSQQRDQTIALLQQVTGMSDIMQGGLNNQYEGVGQSQIKAKFGSIRIQKLQEEFATFASGLMQLKAEVICKHFDPKTIVTYSNMQFSYDQDKLPQAVELVKSPKMAQMRITIRPESIAMTDFAQLQEERTGYLTAISTFMQSASPLIQADPKAKPFLLQLLQWGLAGFKGSSEIEGVLDRAIEASQQEAQQEKPDPAQQAQAMQMQIEQAKSQAAMQLVQAKAQADMALREADKAADIETSLMEHRGKMAEINANLQATLAEIAAKSEAEIRTEMLTSEVNTQQHTSSTQKNEMAKDAQSTALELEKEAAKHTMAVETEAAKAQIKIAESEATINTKTE
jgi:hypothetical protein